MAKILSLQNVAKKYRVTYNSHREDAFIVHMGKNKKLKFSPSPKSLYYLNVALKKIFP